MTGITIHTISFKYEEQRRKEPWGIRGICSDDDMPSKYAPDEIHNSMFLPLMKKSLIGAGHRGQTLKTILVIIRYTSLPLICYAQGAEFLLGGPKFLLFMMKIFLPPPKNGICPWWKKSWIRLWWRKLKFFTTVNIQIDYINLFCFFV